MVSPLSLENLVKRYGGVCAVDDVSLTMQEGEIFGLLGPNGAGKTSIISILTTLEVASSGRALVFGKDVAGRDRATKRLLGCVPQGMRQPWFLLVEEVLRFHSGYYGISDNRAHINFLLDRLDMEKHRHKRVRQLSGGMKRRLLIAKALVHQPKLLLLDEPTAGVDIELRASLWQFARELNAHGTAILLTTHYLEEAESLCSRVGILHHGHLLKVDETRNLVKNLTAKEVKISLREAVARMEPSKARRAIRQGAQVSRTQ